MRVVKRDNKDGFHNATAPILEADGQFARQRGDKMAGLEQNYSLVSGSSEGNEK
jgi:hypothetical protein